MTHRLDTGFFRSVVEASIDCFRVLDQEGRSLFMNRAGLATLGIDDFSGHVGAYWPASWPEPGRSRVERGLEAARRGETYRFEGQCPTAHGVMRWWDVVIAPARDGEGRIAGIISTKRDITEARLRQARAEAEALTAARTAAALQSAARIAHVGGWEVDFAAGQAFVSPELCDLLQTEPLPQMPLAEVIAFWDEEDRARLQDGLARTERLGERLDFEGRTARRDDQVVRWWRLIGDPVIEHGRCVALRGAAVETTHWRETQARERSARKAADEMSGFLATMSHEIRTPLNGVLGMAQAMSHDDLSGLQRRRLEAIQTSGEALLSLLNDVLDMSCLEAGQVELEAGLVDPERLIDGARSVFSALARDKDIDLSLSVADDARGPWIGDPLRVRQVLHNLLSNAVKFTERGAIGVEFYQDGRQLSLRVRDSGVGIPQRLLGQVFEKFIQGDTGTTRRYGGSGLGLTITRDLVTMMGGEIGVESVEGRGSVFTVKLPLARAMAPAVAQLASPDRTDPAAVQSGPDDDGLRILAAEDNPTNRLVLKSLLEGVGYELVLVEDGKAAVEAWRDGVWDVILMDIQMPVMDGVTASKVIRDAERRLGRRRTPIVAVTANAMPHHQAQYLAAEMDAVVPKPLDLRKLLETMEAALQPPEARMHKLAC